MAHTLVPSDHVETASVYGRGDEKIGTIERLMLEKKSGTVAYAVVRCGGLLKGEVRHYPVPWDSLKYDVARKAYTTILTLEELRSGPSELGEPTKNIMPPPKRKLVVVQCEHGRLGPNIGKVNSQRGELRVRFRAASTCRRRPA